MNEQTLCKLAIEAMERAYAPYSRYTVGAALLGKSGKVYLGCNVENVAYSPTICAERTAVVKAVSEGERQFAMLAVVGGKHGEIVGAFPPCGVCRQVLSEVCEPAFPVLLVTGADSFEKTTLGALLPCSFSEGKV